MSERQSRITLKDIAEKSGFTVNTVSHALRGKKDISTDTRRKILGIAEELGYVRNLMASSLRSGHSNTVAVIVSDVVNPHFSYIVHHIEACMREAGYSTIVLCSKDIPEQECQAVVTAIAHQADGVLICPSQIDKRPLEILRQSGIPFVIIGRQFAGEAAINQVLCDDREGARLLTAQLLAQGHRRILYVGGCENFSSQLERREGYRRALLDAGLGAEDFLESPYEEYKALDDAGALATLLSKYNPSAVFAFSDAVAWTLINAFRKSGVSVPEDLSVAGFDYIAENLHFLPPLTTVATRSENFSTVAAQVLLDLMKDANLPPRTLRLSMRLIDPDATTRPLRR